MEGICNKGGKRNGVKTFRILQIELNKRKWSGGGNGTHPFDQSSLPRTKERKS